MARPWRNRPTARFAILLLLPALLSLSASPAAAGQESTAPKVGRPAPPLRLAEVVQRPDRAPAEDVSPDELNAALRGKVVVVEFWGTWCGPCVAAMKSLETVERAAAGAQDGGDFAFVYVTDEDPAHVRQWLAADERRRPGGWVVCDRTPPAPEDKHWREGETFAAWGVTGRPATWVLRPEGDGHVVAGAVHAYLLTLDDLRRVRDGKPAVEPNPQTGGGGVFVPGQNRPARDVPYLDVELGTDPLVRYEPPSGKESVPEADVLVTVRKSAYDRAMTRGYSTWINTRLGIPAAQLVEDHYRQRGLPMEWAEGAKEAVPEGLYDYVVRVPRQRWRQYEPLVDATIAAAFGVRGRVEEREADVYLLQAGPRTASLLQDSILEADGGGGTSDWRVTDGVRRVAFVNGDAGWIADHLSEDVGATLDRPVIDATGLPDREARGIDFELSFRDGDAQDLRRQLQERYDLTLVPGRRHVKYLVIERVAPDIEQADQE